MIPAWASDAASLAFSDTLFGSIDVEPGTVFIATGARRSFETPQPGVKGYLATTSGLSLSDAQRFRRGRLSAGDIDRQNRFFIGVERSEGMVFAAVGLGPSFALAKSHNRPPRQRGGAALEANIWLRPDAEQHFALSLLGDTAAGSLWARARYGYKPAGWAFALGPEVAASADRTSGKARLGLHLSDVTVWRIGGALSGGVMWNEKRRPGGYLTAAAWFSY